MDIHSKEERKLGFENFGTRNLKTYRNLKIMGSDRAVLHVFFIQNVYNNMFIHYKPSGNYLPNIRLNI